MIVSTRTWLQVLAALALGVALLLVIGTGLVPAYQSYSIALAATYAIVVLSVGLLAGWAGVWSVGHPALFAIGAYTAAYGSTHGWGLEPTALVAMLLAGACGAFLGFAGARFSVLYIALLTLAFSLVALEVIGRWTDVTGGDQGVPVGELPSVLGVGAIAGGSAAATAAAVVVAALVLVVAVLARPTSLRMRMVAAKAHPLAARSVGIAPEAQTALAFGVSGAVTGLAGVLLGLITGFVSPETFSLTLGINVVAAAVLGGVGTIAGAVVGGVFLAWAPTLADEIAVNQQVLQGGLLIVALLFLPGGVVPALGKLARHVASRVRPPAAGGPAPVREPAPPEPPAPLREDAAPLLDIADLSVVFGGLTALSGVSLTVRPGEVVAIIGPNGAGKTTLVNALSGLVPGGLVTGSVRYRGRELLGRRATGRRGMGIGRTFQHAEPFGELTTLENLLCTRRRLSAARRDAAMRLLDRVGLAGALDRAPLDLPFGLQKRLDLARAVAEGPDLLVLDEPFGGLDAGERALLAAQIRRLRGTGVGMIVIDHVIEDLFAVADRVVAFDFGRPIGDGTPDTVLQDDAVRASYLGATAARSPRAAAAAGGAPLVTLTGIGHHYGGVVALREVDLAVRRGDVLAVVGANGAGKSTLGRVVHATLAPSTGRRVVGEIDGRPVRSSLVPEGRALFRTLSVRENLEVAAYGAGVRGAQLRARLDETLDWLPERVRTRLSIPAAALSGGEQQLLATARALVAGPDLLVLDEPALGLAPAMVDEVYGRIAGLAERGLTVVLLEQLLTRALGVAHEVAVLHDGAIVLTGTPAEPTFAARAEEAYFGRGPALAPAGVTS